MSGPRGYQPRGPSVHDTVWSMVPRAEIQVRLEQPKKVTCRFCPCFEKVTCRNKIRQQTNNPGMKVLGMTAGSDPWCLWTPRLSEFFIACHVMAIRVACFMPHAPPGPAQHMLTTSTHVRRASPGHRTRITLMSSP